VDASIILLFPLHNERKQEDAEFCDLKRRRARSLEQGQADRADPRCGRRLDRAGGPVRDRLPVPEPPADWLLAVPMDWSGGFWEHMARDYPRLQVF
jgi:hypothetical protein